MVGWNEALFATNYPHWDYDDPSRVLPVTSARPTAKRFYLNSKLKLYGWHSMIRKTGENPVSARIMRRNK
jgi:hypothetical protein